MTRRSRSLTFVSALDGLLILAASLAVLVVAGGCAKRPQMAAVSAPAPGVPPPAPVAVAPAPAPAAPPSAPPSPPAEAAAPTPPAPPAPAPAEPPPAVAAAPPSPEAPAKESPPPAPAAPVVAERPARPPHPPREFMPNDALNMIHFDFDKADIRAGDDADILLRAARWLNDNPNELVLIEGHCDSRGTNEYNLALGERRVRSAMTYLVANGVSASRITVVSYGEERPLCSEETEECWARNRRAAFLTRPRP